MTQIQKERGRETNRYIEMNSKRREEREKERERPYMKKNRDIGRERGKTEREKIKLEQDLRINKATNKEREEV